MLPLLLLSNALADPLPVVAMGDGVVAAAPADPAARPSAVPGGWVAVLADCLQERAPQRFSVVDRAIPGDTVRAAHDRVAGVRELGPAWVIVTLGARELGEEQVDSKKLGKELEGVVGELRQKRSEAPDARAPNVLLVGVVPPTLAQADPASEAAAQTALDERTAGWNKVLGSIASPGQGIVHLDPWSDWPREGERRGALTSNGWSLSDQGHAKIAAAVCDAVLAAKP